MLMGVGKERTAQVTALFRASSRFISLDWRWEITMSDQMMRSDSITRRHLLQTRERRVATEVENFGFSENLDEGGGISRSTPGLIGVWCGRCEIAAQVERKMSG